MLPGPPRWLPRRSCATGTWSFRWTFGRDATASSAHVQPRVPPAAVRVTRFRAQARHRDGGAAAEAVAGQGSGFRAGVCSPLNPSRGVRPSRPVSGMQPGFSSHVWGASGGLRLGLCSLVPAARVCLTLRMRGTGRGERWECDPQMDAPLRAPPSPEGHRATGIFQNELPWQVPRPRLSGFLTRGLSLASPRPPPLAGSAWVWRGPSCLTGPGGFHRGGCQLLLAAAIWDAGFVRI